MEALASFQWPELRQFIGGDVEEETKIQLFEPAQSKLEGLRPELLQPYQIAEAEEGTDLRAYWRTIQKRRWTILTVLLVTFTVVLIVTIKEKPMYRADALLEIEKENPNIPTVQELFQLADVSDNYLETQYKVLQSESLARRVINQVHLAQLKEFNRPKGGWFRTSAQAAAPTPGSIVDPDTEQTVLREFDDRLSVDPVRRSRLVQVSFESHDPNVAAQVVNALASNFIQGNLESRWQAAQDASQWLSQQLESFKAKLEKSEDDLQRYAQNNGLLFLETEKGDTENIVDERLRQLQDELTKAQADRYAKESLYRLTEAGDYSSLPGVVDNKLMQDLTVRLADLEREKAALTPTFTSDYPKVEQIQSQIDDVENTLTQERKRAAQGIVDDYQAAVRRENLVREAFQQQQNQANLVAGRAVQYNILKREVDTNKQLYEGLLQRLKEAGVSAGMNASNIRIVDTAVPPTKPVSPRPVLNLGLALLLGLGGGVGIAFLQERLDNTLKTSDDIERILRVPALALIPDRESLSNTNTEVYGLAEHASSPSNGNGELAPLEKRSGKTWVRIDGNGTQHSALSEAFRGLRTSVLLSAAGRPPRSLTFVSAEPGEGKTTVASNLSISLAQLGKRVLLIDGDMRRPCVHKLFNVEDHSGGLVTYLTGEEEGRQLVRPTGITDLDCLVCGPVPPNPSELLSSDRMQMLIREALEEYQFVLIDAPPLMNVADGRILATMVEGTILVIKGGFTPRELAQQAQMHVRDVGAHLIGVVLNDVDIRHNSYYNSYYRYGAYGEKNGQVEKN
ncbi:MAG: polysaccharide biosynthesis tyrosine autokinase [Candidatus Acidiferrales bacterium]